MDILALRFSGANLVIAQDLIGSRLKMAKRMGADITIDGKLPHLPKPPSRRKK